MSETASRPGVHPAILRARRSEDVLVGDEIVRHRLASRAIHWGFAGDPAHTGPLANTLTPSAMDPNTWTPEYKAFLVKLEKA